jgi:hypothetical protein
VYQFSVYSRVISDRGPSMFVLYRPDDLLITVAEPSKARTVIAYSNTGIVGSDPTWDIDVCVRLFCVYDLCADSGLLTGWSPSKESHRLCKRLRTWKSGQAPRKGCRATEKKGLMILSLWPRLMELFNVISFIKLPITVAARSKTWTVFARSNAGIVGSNPTQDMNVCVYSMFV